MVLFVIPKNWKNVSNKKLTKYVRATFHNKCIIRPLTKGEAYSLQGYEMNGFLVNMLSYTRLPLFTCY